MQKMEMISGVDVDPMLFHDFRGETFEKLVCQFSAMVVQRMTEEVTRAHKTAKGPSLSGSEQKSLLPLATAHQASLTNLLKEKQSQQALVKRLNNLLAMKKALLKNTLRIEKIPDKIDARGAEQHAREVAEIAKQCDIDWESDLKWKEIILGNKIEIPDELWNLPSSKEGFAVFGSASHDAPTPDQPNRSGDLNKTAEACQAQPPPYLLEDLNKRLDAQEARVERWTSFIKQFKSSAPKECEGLESTKWSDDELKCSTIDVPGCGTFDGPRRDTFNGPRRNTFDGSRRGAFDGRRRGNCDGLRRGFSSVPRLGGSAFGEPGHGDSDEPDHGTLSGPSPRRGSVIERVEEYEKLMEMMNANLPGVYQLKISCTRTHVDGNGKRQSCAEGATKSFDKLEIDLKAADVRPSEEKSPLMEETSDVLSQKPAQSTVSGPSSPSKLPTPLKYRPSLVERTRESMALAKAEDMTGSSMIRSEDVPTLPIRIPENLPSGLDNKLTRSETLVERTRKSMSLLPVKSRAPRTHSLKKPPKVYPINPFETPKKSHSEMPGVSTPPEELFDQNAKYASVFKSRPKVALSPTRSPSLGCMDVVYKAENDLFKGDNANESTGRS